MARRLVEKVDQPNVLLDEEIEWTCPVNFIPRLNHTPRGWGQFRFCDNQLISSLNLPVVPADSDDLFILSTGPYGIKRGQITLTATREYELRAMRESGRTGSLAEYNVLASTLPQTTPVLYLTQVQMPIGWSEAKYGEWIGQAVLLKCQFASSHKSPASRSNLHTVTLLVSDQEPVENPLQLTGSLKRLLFYSCTCKSGEGTNRACAHVLAMVIGLISPDSFISAKKNLGRVTDVNLPSDHQPTITGKTKAT